MVKILLSLILCCLMACQKKESPVYRTDGRLLKDNMTFVYDNYKYANVGDKIENFNSAVSCVESCVSDTLKIAIMPMSFGSPSVMTEIQNTADLVMRTDGKKIDIVESNDIKSYLTYNTPDVIISAFVKSDIANLQKAISQTSLNIPIISMLNEKGNAKENIFNFGYYIKEDVRSMVSVLKKQGYKRFAFFGKNDDISASLYKAYNEITQNEKQNITYVEFYETNTLEKKLKRLESASIYYYFENTENGNIVENDHHFKKNIVETIEEVGKDGKKRQVFITKNKKRFYKKSHTVDAIIIDADTDSLPKIIEFIENSKQLKNVIIVASPRTVDTISIGIANNQALNSPIPIFFASNFTIYNQYLQQYISLYGQKPSRLSVTIYDAIKYAAESSTNDGKFNIKALPIFIGLNGTMIVEKNGITQRFVNISKLHNGTAKEVIDSYHLLK